jgi:hypothetical protein
MMRPVRNSAACTIVGHSGIAHTGQVHTSNLRLKSGYGA